MVLKPGLQGAVFALPGLLLSGWFALIAVAGFATGMPLGVAGEIFGIALALSILWVPVVLYLLGTRLTVDADGLELRQWFGRRVRRLSRYDIGRIATSEGSVASEPGDAAAIPVAYYEIFDTEGRRFVRLRSWVWSRSECERLRAELLSPGSAAVAVPPRAAPTPRETVDDGFLRGLQSAGCAVQGLSMLFGFGLTAVVVAGVFNIPLGDQLGGYAVPGAMVGAGIGSSALLSRRVYRYLVDRRKISTLTAKALAIVSVVLIPLLVWAAAFVIVGIAFTILGAGG